MLYSVWCFLKASTSVHLENMCFTVQTSCFMYISPRCIADCWRWYFTCDFVYYDDERWNIIGKSSHREERDVFLLSFFRIHNPQSTTSTWLCLTFYTRRGNVQKYSQEEARLKVCDGEGETWSRSQNNGRKVSCLLQYFFLQHWTFSMPCCGIRRCQISLYSPPLRFHSST